jgi:uncharacterized membrane protein
MNVQYGKIIIFIGSVLLIFGVLIYFWGDKFSWFGKLPGDIRIEKTNFKIYFPITTMLIISLLLNLIIWILKKIIQN